MIDIKNKKDCCGCWACYNACPKNCITMQEDDEGFLYPIIDRNMCIDCGLCEKVCPILNVKKDSPHAQKLFIIQNKNNDIRQQSTSGGAFSPIAEYVIRQGGVVFGAAFKSCEDLTVQHQKVETVNDIVKLRGSKYVQSEIGQTYSEAKRQLQNNRLVCFSGTPCQIEGLYSFLRKDYENLITVDLECRAVPSPLVWGKYVEYQKNEYGDNFDHIRFRDKILGYSYSTMSVYAKEKSKKKDYHKGIESDWYLRMFFSGISTRPCCSKCKFRKKYHVSDFTLWDCFTVGSYNKSFDDNKGTTRMMLQTTKAIEIFSKIKEDYKYAEIPENLFNIAGKEVAYHENYTFKRTDFYNDLNLTKCPKDVFQKYFPYTTKIRILEKLRYATYKLGIYTCAKKLFNIYKNKTIKS